MTSRRQQTNLAQAATDQAALIQQIRTTAAAALARPDLAPPLCQRCEGTRWEPVTIDGVTRMQRCTGCTVAVGGDAEGIPADERGKTLDTIDLSQGFPADAIRQAELFMRGIHPGLYLTGEPGGGKSMLAARILNTLRQQPGAPLTRFVRVLDLLDRLQAAFGPDPDAKAEADQLLRDVCQVGVLVLDDVGTQKTGSEYVRRVLQLIQDRRHDAGLGTVWTSNYSLDELAEHLGGGVEADRIVSRLAQSCKVVLINPGDYRFYLAKQRRART